MPRIVRHARSLRLFNNAGIRFPLCYANAQLLDMDKSRLTVTSDRADVSCKRCQKLLRQPWRQG